MKIIETPGSEWSDEFVCTRCATRFEADQNDLEFSGWKVSGYHFAGTAVIENRFSVTCPSCPRVIFIPRKDLPILLADRLEKESTTKS